MGQCAYGRNSFLLSYFFPRIRSVKMRENWRLYQLIAIHSSLCSTITIRSRINNIYTMFMGYISLDRIIMFPSSSLAFLSFFFFFFFFFFCNSESLCLTFHIHCYFLLFKKKNYYLQNFSSSLDSAKILFFFRCNFFAMIQSFQNKKRKEKKKKRKNKKNRK